MYDMKPLIQKFRNNRKRLGINQTEFARRIGSSLATITRWERGNMVYTPDLRQLSLIADLFDTTVWELLTPDATETVTNNENMTEMEAPTAEIESIAQETSPIVSSDEIEEGPSATTIVNSDEPIETPTDSLNMAPQDQALGTITPDETSQTGDALPPAPSDEALSPEAVASEAPMIVTSDDVQEETPQPPEAQAIITSDEEPAAMETPEIVSHEEPVPVDEPMSEVIINDEPQKTPQTVMSDESASIPLTDSEEVQESPLTVINDETQEDPNAPSLGIDEELPQTGATAESQEIVSSDEQEGSSPNLSMDIMDAHQGQVHDVVMTDEMTPIAETVSTEIPESVINDETISETSIIAAPDETQEESVTPDAVNSDEKLAEDNATQELFSIAAPDASQMSQEPPAAEVETADSEISSIIRNDEIVDGRPEATIITPDDITESVTPDEEKQPETLSVMNDETTIGEATTSETLSILNNEEPKEEQPTTPVVTPDDTIAPASVAEAEQAVQVETPIEDSAAPELFSIITSDETPQKNDAPVISASDELPQEAPAPEAPSIVSNEEPQGTPADTPIETKAEQMPVVTNATPKPWETLGMSKAWYYRLRQQGRLEEYLKEKAGK